MRILKLFKKHILALLAAIVLIVISCNADLALPTYMSDIVDVGVQQGGIASPVPDTIRAESLDDLELFMSTKDAKAVEAVFSKADNNGIRTYKGTEEERADGGKIADIMSLPETVVLSFNQGIDANSMGDMMGTSGEKDNSAAQAMPTPEQMAAMTPEQLAEMQQKAAAAQNMQKQIDADGGKITMKGLRLGVEGSLIDQGKLVEGANDMADKMGSMSGSIVTQRAVSYVQDEYKAQGIDPAAVQNAYLGRMATTMFGLCLVSLVATILTGAVASRTACSIARDLRRETFNKVMHFSPAEVGKFSQASLITRCTNDIQQIQMAATLFIRMCLMAPVMGIVAVMRVLANHTGLEWTIAVAIIAVSAVVGVLMGLTMPKFKKMQSFVDRVNLTARELLDGLMPIRSFNREEHELERFDKASLDLMTTQLYTNRAMSFMMPLMMLVMNCITVLIVWFGAQGVSDGVMQVGNMMAFISYTMQIVMAFMILTMVSVILPRAEAVKLMEERQEHYKIEHMADLADETEFSFFQQGEYVDMCIGPHLTYTKALKAFKITQQSGAYWKNDKENKMLTRINGVAFRNQEELDAWEKEQQEARERDHRKIGKEMGLFMTDDLVGRGLPMFLPAGYTVWQELENYIKEKERARGYLHVMTPCIGTVNLYKTSGHWDHYRENMFPAMEMEGESYVLRPMNCPHHMMIYANRPHSYRDLPMRIGEIAHDFRYESSGTLKGIERGRHFCQNDAHLFCTPEQIKSEVADVCNLIFEVYKDFNITDYRCVLSLRDPADKKKYHDDDAMWNHAEQALREVLTELGIHFTEEIGEAAFYGPKLDVNVKPAVGAEYTLSTCQLDFCLPAKFHLTYVDKDGSEKTPVVLHRAILGSLDRFMAYLIEETKGKFPTWLAPTQVKVLPVSEKTLEYAQDVTEKLSDAGIRVVLDDDNQKIGYKIRAAQQVDRVPYMLVLGAKEAEAGNISVRDRKGETTEMSLEDFIAKVTTEIRTRSL